jgi:hypothetical protein
LKFGFVFENPSSFWFSCCVKVGLKFVCDATSDTMPTPKKEEREHPSDPNPRKSALKPFAVSPSAARPEKSARVADDVVMVGEGDAGSAAGSIPGPPGFPTGAVPVTLATRLFPSEAGVETPVPDGGAEPSEEPTMRQMFEQMLKMQTNLSTMESNLSTKIDNVQMQFETLKNEIQAVKQDMVTKVIFQSLEDRVLALEQGGVNNSQMNWMHQQVGRLDPANKSLCLKGFSEKDAAKRFKIIETMLDTVGHKSAIQNIEHIWTGPKGDRHISPNSVIELSSRAVREAALKQLKEDNSILTKSEFQGIKCDRAKTSMQRKRNDSLHRVCEIVKKDPRSQGKIVSIQ